ncbi:hypothetical protein INT47_002209 [Mucor saturninus]|uniref:F-box domain-containing protein n=1 Tax=Mucor saturninus TaxID=64648 RepID=A0A8H7V2U1_9FUNG|nr:hypothetical protein INT47_002209 [Mucor saturninus]
MHKRKEAPTAKVEERNKKTQSIVGVEAWKLVFNDARQAFTDNQFKEAVALFTRALTLNPNHITLLDCRAASYEKLDQTKLALADAATIVKLAPTDPRGYLRGGKLFANQKKYSKALGLYNRALQKVDPVDPRYNLIVDLKSKAEKASKPPASMNMMDRLPYDVIGLIFSYLSFDRRVQCSAVSQSWRRFALQWAGMWRHLDFENRKPTLNIIRKYLGYAKGRHVRGFSLHNASQTTLQNVFKGLVDENCQYIETLARMLKVIGKHVEYLNLDHTNLTVSNILDVVIPMCPKLTHLSILGLAAGQEYAKTEYPLLNLTYIRCNIFADKLIRLSPHLVTIDVHSNSTYFHHFYNGIVTTHKELETLHFSYGHTSEKIGWSPNSCVVSQRKGILNFGIYEDRFFNANVLQSFLIENPHLQQLTVVGCGPDIGTGIETVVTQGAFLSQLVEIHLLNCPSLTETGLHHLVVACPSLQAMSVPRLLSVTDAFMQDVATRTLILKKLDISDCSAVTGVGLQNLVRAHKHHLQKLVLNNCQRISPDAVKWAVEQLGPRVIECKFKYK